MLNLGFFLKQQIKAQATRTKGQGIRTRHKDKAQGTRQVQAFLLFAVRLFFNFIKLAMPTWLKRQEFEELFA